MSKKRRNYEDLGDYEMPPNMVAKVDAMIKQADEEDELARVNFRWSKEPLDVVKQAAKLMGIPYQTFIKQTVFEHALEIIKEINSSKKSA
ncbi:hypothetical protein KA183_20835 [bacterium]|nr:hypothetical protein [bacterium]